MEIKRPKKQIAELERVTEILRSASVFFATELGLASGSSSSAAPCAHLRGNFCHRADTRSRRAALRQPEHCQVSCSAARPHGCTPRTLAFTGFGKCIVCSNGSAGRSAGIRPGDSCNLKDCGASNDQKRVFTTESDPSGKCPTDLVQRHFRADAPPRL